MVGQHGPESTVPLRDWNVRINRGILTGFNKAFIINEEIRQDLIRKSPKNAEIIRPILKGRNIKKYDVEFDNLWVIFTRRGIAIDEYPAIKDYLYAHYEDLKPKVGNDATGRKPGTYKWYEIQDNVAYYNDFEKDKIVWLELTDKPKFAYDNQKFFIEATAFIMTGDNLKFLTVFLNSRLCEWYFDKITTTSGVGTNRWKKVYIENIPVPKLRKEQLDMFSHYLDNLLDLQKENSDTSELEAEINNAIYQLYPLESFEIELVQGTNVPRYNDEA